MTVRRLQEVSNDPTAPVLAIDDSNGVITNNGAPINSGGTVTSVASKTGAVTLVEGDVTNLTTDLAAKAPLASPLFTGKVGLPKYTVVTLPVGAEGYLAYATNGRKVGEGAGNGTGVPVYFSNTQWRVFSTDAQVTA